MIYDSKDGLAFQRKDKYYRFISSYGWHPLEKKIHHVDSGYIPIGPTILVEWEE